MERKKLLICGSAGFLMSNLIRYLFYAKSDFDIVSFDSLKNVNDIKRLYIHKNHKFYIGDICDENFLDKLLWYEKPDYVISGIHYNNQQNNKYEDIIKAASNLSRISIPVIQVSGNTNPSYDTRGVWNCVHKMIEKSNGTIVQIPNVFGFRQKLNIYNTIPYVLNEVVINNKKKIGLRKEVFPWVYVEDACSLLWFILEHKITGNISMPVLGSMSQINIGTFIQNLYKLDFEIETVALQDKNREYMITNDYKYNDIEGWCFDSIDVCSSLEKTVLWYDRNRWMFKL